MKWRRWPDEKPLNNGSYLVRDLQDHGIRDLVVFYQNIGWDKHQDGIGYEFEWLDESDEAFEEVARERGWVKEEEADRRLDSALFSQIHG